MDNIIFTENGSRWIASAMCGVYRPVDTVYVIYSNTDSRPTIPNNPAITYFESVSGAYGCLGSSRTTCLTKDSTAVFTAIVSEDDKITGTLSSTSKLVSVALVSGSDVIMLADFDNPVQWVPGSSMTISVPLGITSTSSEA